MKVDFVKNTQHPKNNINSSVKFCGKGVNLNELSKTGKLLPRALAYIGQNNGEILNTWVTAIGTACVTPVFIALNPLAKEDKETKFYTAGRQPVSALTALVMQLSVNTLFNNWMASIASTGLLKRADLRAMPEKSYLKRLIKLEHPEYNKKQVTEEIIKRQILAEKKRLSELRVSMKDTSLNIKDLICKDILDVAQKQLTGEYMTANEQSLKGLKPKEIQKILKAQITSELINERAIKNLEAELELKAKTKFEIRELAKKFATVDEAIDFVKQKNCSTEREKEIVSSIISRLENIKIYEEKHELKSFSSLKNIGKTYEEVLHNVKIKQFLRSKTSDAQKVLGKYKNQLGIIVSLVTLPISCGMLNWLYPRIMEDVMPAITRWIHRHDKVVEAKKEVNNG